MAHRPAHSAGTISQSIAGYEPLAIVNTAAATRGTTAERSPPRGHFISARAQCVARSFN
jgi:hypothetical protein